MDKNIVALVREDVKTVKVKFFPDIRVSGELVCTGRYQRETAGKEYTYVTTFPCKPADLALVFVGERPAIVEIQSVDGTLNIQLNEGRAYKWIAAIIDTAPYEKLMEQNQKLEDILRNEYQKNIRRQFRDVFLATSSPDTLKLLDEVLK